MRSPSRRIGIARDVERMAGYEVARLRISKGIWIALGLSVVSGLAASGTLEIGKGQGVSDASNARAVWIDVLTSPVSVTAIIAGVAGASIGGQEMRWGTLVDIFIRLGRRRSFVMVKSVTAAFLGGTMCLAAVVVGWLIVNLSGGPYASRLGREAGLTMSTQSFLLGRVFVVGMFCALMAMSVTFATRSLVAGVAIPVVWANVLEPLLAVLGGHGSILVRCLPYQSMRSFVSLSDSGTTGISTASATLVMAVCILVVGFLGVWRIACYEW